MTGYFSHDINASRDPKLVKLRMKHKWDGYGIYWAIVEKLAETKGYRLPLDIEVLSFDLRADAGTIKSIIHDFGLFVCTPKDEYGCVYFYSESLLKRMEIKDSLSEKRREAGKKRWLQKTESDNICLADEVQKLSKCTANAKQMLNNKIKGNKIKENISSDDDIKKASTPTSPSLNDFGAMDRMFSLDELLIRMQSDDAWHAAVHEREKLPKDAAPEMIKIFIAELRAQGVNCKSERDAKQHFLNWYRINKTKVSKNESKTELGSSYRPNPKRYTGTGTPENSYNGTTPRNVRRAN